MGEELLVHLRLFFPLKKKMEKGKSNIRQIIN